MVEREDYETADEAKAEDRRSDQSDVVRVKERLELAVVYERQSDDPDGVIEKNCDRHDEYDFSFFAIAL